MDVYSKNGDRGTTELVHSKNVSKADDRVRLLGSLDELICHLNLFLRKLERDEDRRAIRSIREVLQTIMGGIRDPYSHDFRLSDTAADLLDTEIHRMQQELDARIQEVGTGELSDEVLLGRAVCRRAESDLASVGVKFGADHNAKKFMNRLSDYLDLLAKTVSEVSKDSLRDTDADHYRKEASAEESKNSSTIQRIDRMSENTNTLDEKVIQEVLRRIGAPRKLTLNMAKQLIDEIEKESLRRGLNSVIAICDPAGNPMAVHVMDDAFLVSFDVALKKAYSSVAVKMSTKELGKLAQPGETFYGVDKMGDGRMTIVAGGIPLFDGDMIIGGLGVSGGTGEQDHSLAEYGVSVLKKIF